MRFTEVRIVRKLISTENLHLKMDLIVVLDHSPI